MANSTKKTLCEIITSKIMNESDFNLGKYTDEDVKGAIEMLQKYDAENKKFNKNKDANKKMKDIKKMNEDERRYIWEQLSKEFGK